MVDSEVSAVYRNIISVPPTTTQRFLQLEQEAASGLTKLGVRLAGIGTFGLDYRVGYRDPACHLVLQTLAGDGFYESPDARFRLSEGDVLISPLGVPMLLGTIDQPWSFLWFYVNGLQRWQYLDRTTPQVCRPKHVAQLQFAMEGLLCESGHAGTQTVLTESGWVAGDSGPMLPSNRAANLFGELVAEYLRQILQSPAMDADPWEVALQEMWKAVEQSPKANWSQEAMCQRLGVSPATLQRLVRRYFDSSPQQMVISIRMNQARRLLQHSEYPLALIAREVGYADAFVFSTAFKRYHGQSPSHFRETGMIRG